MHLQFQRLLAGTFSTFILIFTICSSLAATPGEIAWMQAGYNWDIVDLKSSSDGSRLFCASADGTVKLWTMPEGRLTRSFIGYTNIIRALAVNSAGTLMACGGDGGEVILWDADSGGIVRRFTPHPFIGTFAFTPDGSGLLTGSGITADPTMKLWSVPDGSLLQTYEGHTSWITAARFKPDGKTLVSGSVDRSVRVWNAATGEPLDSFNVGAGFIFMDVSPSGESVAIGRTNILRFATADWAPLPSLGTGLRNVRRVSFSPDGSLVAAGFADMTVRIWRTDTTEQIFFVTVPEAQTQPGLGGVVFSPDGKLIYTGGSDFEVREWDVQSGNQVRSLTQLNGPMADVQFMPDSSAVLATSEFRVRGFDASTGTPVLSLPHTNASVVACSPDGEYVVSAGSRLIRVWNAHTGEPIHSTQEHLDAITDIDFSQTSVQFASVSADATLKVWEPGSALALKTFNATNELRAVLYSKDGGTILTGDEMGIISWWSLSEGKVTNAIKAHDTSISNLKLSPDGQTFASTSPETEGKLKLWNFTTGSLVREFSAPSGVRDGAFSPDGSMIAGAFREVQTYAQLGDVRIWRLSDGELLHTFTNETHRGSALAWSSNGDLALGRQDGSLIMIKAPSSNTEEVIRLEASISPVQMNLSLTAPAGQSITIERSSNLETWETHLVVSGTGASQSLVPITTSGEAQFFRARSAP